MTLNEKPFQMHLKFVVVQGVLEESAINYI